MYRVEIKLHDPAATARLGFLLAETVRAGDVIALSGPLGAGKSVLARGVVLALCPDEADIPSPTFTLVQTYEPADGPVLMHFDLYRIEDAFVEAVSIIEWPERLGAWLPRDALRVTLAHDEASSGTRMARLEGSPRWQPLLEQAGDLFAG